MSLSLKPDMIQATYVYLTKMPPFIRWKLPHPSELKFKVGKSRHNFAWYSTSGMGRGRKRSITVSAGRVGRTFCLVETVAHEMIHLHMDVAGLNTGGSHTPVFNRLAASVCRIHGFDPKTF